MAFTLNMESGMIQTPGPLDICKVPAPPAPPIPTPFPNMGIPATANPVTKKVLIGGTPALTSKSQIKPTMGDQVGVAGGLISGKIMGEIEFTSFSIKVKLEGEPGVSVGNTTTHNAKNAIGAALDPGGQTLVSFGG